MDRRCKAWLDYKLAIAHAAGAEETRRLLPAETEDENFLRLKAQTFLQHWISPLPLITPQFAKLGKPKPGHNLPNLARLNSATIREFSPENFPSNFCCFFFFFSTTSLVLSNLTIYTASSGTQKAERCQAQIYTPDLSCPTGPTPRSNGPNWAPKLAKCPGPGNGQLS